jgi:hypothetical protein
MGAAAARRTVIPMKPMTVYNRYSLRFTTNKMYRLLVIVYNGLSNIVTCYFDSKCTKQSSYSLYLYSYFKKRVKKSNE